MGGTIKRLIQRLIAEKTDSPGYISPSEWNEILKPALEKTNLRPSADLDAIINAIANNKFGYLNNQDYHNVTLLLWRAGYDVPGVGYGKLNPISAREVIHQAHTRKTKQKRTELYQKIDQLSQGGLKDTDLNKKLVPLLDRLPQCAGPEWLVVLDVLANPEVNLSPKAQKLLSQYLRQAGYEIPAEKRLVPEDIADIRCRNITEPDSEFIRLTRIVQSHEWISIGVIDGGFYQDHPALQQAFWTNTAETIDGQDNDNNGLIDDVHGVDMDHQDGRLDRYFEGWDGVGHGSNVLGIAVQGTPRIKAIAGIIGGPDLVLKTLKYQIGHGAKVINLSFNFLLKSANEAVVSFVREHPEILFCIAAGNEGKPISELNEDVRVLYCNLPNAVFVTAATSEDVIQPNANFGQDIVALGAITNTPSVDLPHSYRIGTLTSMAAPQATNTAAKCLLLCPSLTATQLKALLMATCDRKVGWEKLVKSGGLLNRSQAMLAAAAIQLLRQGILIEAIPRYLNLTHDAWQAIQPIVDELGGR